MTRKTVATLKTEQTGPQPGRLQVDCGRCDSRDETDSADGVALPQLDVQRCSMSGMLVLMNEAVFSVMSFIWGGFWGCLCGVVVPSWLVRPLARLLCRL